MSDVIVVVLILIAIFATGFAFGSLFWPRYHQWRRARQSEKIGAELMPVQPPMRPDPNQLPEDLGVTTRFPVTPPSPFAPPSKRSNTPTADALRKAVLAKKPQPPPQQPPQPPQPPTKDDDDKTERVMLPSIEWGR